MPKRPPPTNPFRYGALALDDAFTNRAEEVAELRADMRNGQDVVVFAPRRYGKSSLVWRAAQEALKDRLLVAQVNLMTAPTKEKLAEKLAKAIHDELASASTKARDRLAIFGGLRVAPVVTVDPASGSLGFTFSAGHSREDVDATLERLFELPGAIAAERKRRVVLVLDEFQEVVDIDPGLPKLMRSVFQEQPEVSHVYLGSKRHMMTRIFNDANEPFWRSAKQLELGVIAPVDFAPYIERRFTESGRKIDPETIGAVLEITRGHPYATQELCYFLWEEGSDGLGRALDSVLRSEHAHFTLLWDRSSAAQRLVLQALAEESGRPYSAEYRQRHGLPAVSSIQRALDALVTDEVVAREAGNWRIVEPFLAEWIRTRVAET